MADDPQAKLRATLIQAAQKVKKLQKKIIALEASKHEPIAIIGIDMRLPGGVHDLDSLWAFLERGGDAIAPFPSERWDAQKFYDPDPNVPGKSYVREGACIEGIDQFDADFFSISPREAESLDPQHRLLLESAWHALEHAGIVPASLVDSPTGVFVGIGPSDYAKVQAQGELSDAYEAMGTQVAFAAGRVAYHLGLQGPTLPVATACSSALVALHLASQALRAGECELAIVAGVQVMASAENFVHLSQIGALASDARCKTFSAQADGYGRGEGVVTIAVERLSVAQANKRTILAVVRGTAVNHNGASNGMVAPSGLSQQKVLRAALANAGLEPKDIDLVECNGTGTKLGDPIEIQALAKVYAKGFSKARPLQLGAFKTNIGHLEPASALAGIAKLIAAMQHGAVPASLHTQPRNPRIDWDALPLHVVDQLCAWPTRADDGPRRAGLSAFGMSGTNAHLILEQAPDSDPSPDPAERAQTDPWAPLARVPICISGRNEASLRDQARQLRAHLDNHRELRAADLAFSLARSRTHFQHRACLLATSREGLLEALDSLADKSGEHGRVEALARVEGKLVFVFPGQGAQWAGMARPLLEQSAVFRATMQACAAALDPHTGWSLLETARGGPSAASLDRIDVIQPLLFATMVALAAVMRERGLTPDAVIGHSQGELAAAHVAGMLSLEDAAKIVALRARLIATTLGPNEGGMASIARPATEVEALLRQPAYAGQLQLAADNGPSGCAVAGPHAVLRALLSELEREGIPAQDLELGYAPHCAAVEGIEGALREALVGLSPRAHTIPMVSTVDGSRIEGPELDASYWYRNLRQPVRFAETVDTLLRSGHHFFVELGPQPVLALALQGLLDRNRRPATSVAVLRRQNANLDQVTRSLGELHCHGYPLDWDALLAPHDPQRVELPTYAFQRRRYWVDTPDFAPAQADTRDQRLLQLDWEPAAPAASGQRDGSRWLVLSNREPLATTLADKLRTHGLDAEVISPIDPGEREQVAALVDKHIAQGAAVAGILCLWALDASPDPSADKPDPWTAIWTGPLQLAREIDARSLRDPPRLVLVSERAHAVDHEAVRAGQALSSAAGTSIRSEFPLLVPLCIDLGDPDADAQLDTLVAFALARGNEDQISVRADTAYVARLHRAPPLELEQTPLRADGTYLVSSTLDPALALELVAKGARHLLVVGPAQARLDAEVLASLTAAGATITREPGPAQRLPELRALVAKLAEDLPLRGLVHAMAPLADRPLSECGAAQFNTLTRALEQTWDLHQLASEHAESIELFVLHGSTDAVFGTPGQGLCAALSSFFSGLVDLRRGQASPAQLLAWGPLSDTGARSGRGLDGLEPSERTELCSRALFSPRAELFLCRFDVHAFADYSPTSAGWPLLTDLLDEAPAPRNESADAFMAALEGMPAGERVKTIAGVLLEQLAAVIRADVTQLDPDAPFATLGVDSLMGIELRNRMQGLTGLEIPPTAIWTHPSTTRLAEHLATLVSAPLDPPASPTSRPSSALPPTELDPHEPIAVIGMACRFPGGPDPEAFWTTLVEGRDMVREIPDDRLIGPWPEGVPRWAGLLDDVASFDPGFFGISPFEALSIDPQHRLLLELSWEALEHARLIPEDLRGSMTGVFVGLTGSEYLERIERRSHEDRSAYDVTGIMPSVAAGRVSYTLGFQGPAISMDTACSSALVAVHLACQSLRSGGCNLALAGGVKIVASEHYLELLALTQGLSPDGRCKAFDSRANGFVLGEGAGVVALKRLADAQRDGDPILGLLRGSAVNQDGRSTNLTAPNVLAQEAVLRQALASADLRPEQIGLLECHGTGTALGDPIEIDAIKAVFGQPRSDNSALWLGASKTHVGHLEAAAGVVGLIKVLLALAHEQLPANLHLRHLNPRIKLSGTPLELLSETVEWPHSSEHPRLAGVSSFGMSGTNAHLIVEQAPARAATPKSAPLPAPPTLPILLSARSEAALRAQATRLREHLVAAPTTSRADLASTLATTRSRFDYRACIVAEDLAAGLTELADPSAHASHARATEGATLAMLFTGQGAQRPGMGATLYAQFPGYRSSFDEICACFAPLLQAHDMQTLEAVVFAAKDTPEAALIHQTGYTQPALFALEVALARLLASWGITPQVLMGHSIGELAAAHVAGVFSLADACRLVAERGRLMQALPTGGVMISIQASERELAPLLESHPGVDIAGLNGPLSTVLSGDAAQARAIAEIMQAQQRQTKELSVSHAFHSAHMEPMLEPFRALARSITYAEPTIPILSNVSGSLAQPGELSDPEYWVRHVRAAVRFLDGVRALEASATTILLEIGPHAVLSGMARACNLGHDEDPGRPELITIPCLHRRADEVRTLFGAVGALHGHGVQVDWPAVFEPYAARTIDLPTYAFDRAHYWIEVTPEPTRARSSQLSLLGERIASPLPVAQFRAQLDPSKLPLYSKDQPGQLHPATILDMVLLASKQVVDGELDPAVTLQLDQPLALPDPGEVNVQLLVHPPPSETGSSSFELHAEDAESHSWLRIAQGELARTDALRPRTEAPASPAQPVLEIGPSPLASAPNLPGGFRAQLVHSSASGGFEFHVELQPSPADFGSTRVHPAGFDAVMQLALWLGSDRTSAALAYTLVGWDRAQIAEAWPLCFKLDLRPIASVPSPDPDPDPVLRFDIDVCELEGSRVLARFEGVALHHRGAIERQSSNPYKNLEQEIITLAEHTLNVSPASDDDIAKNDGVDSLSLIAFMAALQKAYGVSLAQMFQSSSFSVRSLAGVIRGEDVVEDTLEVDFHHPSSPLDVRKLPAESLPPGYAVGESTTWACRAPGVFDIEIVDFGGSTSQDTLVFLPPFNSEWPIWLQAMQLMNATHRVLGVNYPGLGRSTRTAGLRDIAQLAAWVGWALDALSFERVTLVGWSLGGFVAQQLSAARPELVARTILVNTTQRLEKAGTLAGTQRLVSELNEHLDQELGEIADPLRDRIRTVVHHGHETRGHDMAYHRMLAGWDFRGRSSQIKQPTLIVTGTHDPITPRPHSQALHEAISNSHYVEIASGHYAPLFATEALCELLSQFLTRTETKANST